MALVEVTPVAADVTGAKPANAGAAESSVAHTVAITAQIPHIARRTRKTSEPTEYLPIAPSPFWGMRRQM